MKRTIPLILSVFIVVLFQETHAEKIQQLSWSDLIPSHLRSDEILSNLNQDQREMVAWVINMLENLPERGPDNEMSYKEVDEAMPSLKKAGIDIAEILEKRKKMRTSIVKELDGQRVRLPGYILPLEVSGDKVHEFLLVPYVGACIHVPPPPPNQIVHVKVVEKGGYKNPGLFHPVWITGLISVKAMSKELYLVDGSASVDIGYSMQANRVEPYK